MPETTLGKRLMVWGGVAGSVTAIIAMLTMLGLKPPIPAWADDLQALEKRTEEDLLRIAGQTQVNQLSILLIRKSALQQEIWSQEDRIEDRIAKGQDVRDARARLRDLRSAMENLDRQIRALEVK